MLKQRFVFKSSNQKVKELTRISKAATKVLVFTILILLSLQPVKNLKASNENVQELKTNKKNYNNKEENYASDKDSEKFLDISEYLSQVRDNNIKLFALDEFSKSYELLAKKAKLVSAIKLYGYSESSFVEQSQALQFVRYNRAYNQNNRIGLSQNSEFGLKTNFYYSLNNVRYQNLNFNTSNPLAESNSQAIPVLELSMPIWQNRFGSSTRASRDAALFENLAQKYSANALTRQEMVDAQKSYWALVSARNSLQIQIRALNAAQKILDYVAKKERMNLGETSDVLQAKANFENRKLAVLQAQNVLKITARNFNKKRNLVSDEVTEKLAEFDIIALQANQIKEQRPDDRLDIKSQKALTESAVAYSKIEEESNKPNVNIYGSYALNQVDKNRVQAINASFQNNAPSAKIGVELSMPLNFGLTSDVRDGFRGKALAEKSNYREKLQQQEVDWQNLVQNLHNYQQNLQMAIAIEKVQKLKLENERKLLRQGRTSTYQILVFEQEFANAQLNTQQIAQKLCEIFADKKLYGEE